MSLKICLKVASLAKIDNLSRDDLPISLKNQLVKGLKIFPQLVDPIGKYSVSQCS